MNEPDKTVPLTRGIGGPVIGTASVAEDGTLTAEVTDPDAVEALRPAFSAFSIGTVPDRERIVHDDPALAARIREGIAEAECGETVYHGSLAQHLDDGDDDE